MSHATVLLVLAALSYGGCNAATSERCIITDQTATCDGEQFEFPLNLPENITQLYIHSTQVKNISKDNFAQYSELEVIDLSNCDITDIDPDTFTALSNLNELNLAGNKDLSGEKTIITSQGLMKLNLSETGIQTIPENFFEELPNLEELDLSSTSLTETEISTLLKLSNLSILIVSNDHADELNNFCGGTNLRTIVFKTVDGDNETHDCLDLKEAKTTPVQEDITIAPTIIVNQSESDDNETKAENTEVSQSKENDGSTTESIEDKENTDIVDGNTEDKTSTVVKPSEEQLETVKTSDEKSKDDEQEEHKIENDLSAAGERHENETLLDTNEDSRIAPVPTNNETAKIDEPETENDAQNTSEAVTENVAGKTDEPETENTDDQTLSENGADGTTTDMNNVNDQDTQALPDNGNSQKNNNIYSAVNPPDGAGDAENKTSEVTSSAVQSSGTNVVLGIILTVMVIGAVGFGYKYWKNRRSGYSNANTEETHEDGKELQTIVTHTDPEQN